MFSKWLCFIYNLTLFCFQAVIERIKKHLIIQSLVHATLKNDLITVWFLCVKPCSHSASITSGPLVLLYSKNKVCPIFAYDGNETWNIILAKKKSSWSLLKEKEEQRMGIPFYINIIYNIKWDQHIFEMRRHLKFCIKNNVRSSGKDSLVSLYFTFSLNIIYLFYF